MTSRGIGVVALAGLLAACGSSTSSSSTTAGTSQASQSSGSTAVVTTGPVRGQLVGGSHTPKVNANWFYTVTVTDASGHPLSGTVVTQFSFGGQVVGRETPPTHKLTNGKLRDRVQFPPPSAGEPIALQTVVRTAAGSITLTWPVTPSK